MSVPSFTIAAVERDTGLSKDVLRVWERRYGFPVPTRDANGERVYTTAQVNHLRLIKRLMDQGHRPGKLMQLDAEQLAALAPRRALPPGATGEAHDAVAGLLELVRQHDADGLVRALQQRLGRQGLQRFVMDTVAPLTQAVGQAWERGQLEVFEEHLFSELTKRVLRQAIASLPRGTTRARVLLTTVPDEQHILGLLMVEAVLALEGAECIPLGTQMPLGDIDRAARAHQADIVALSFSQAFATRQIPELLRQLRALLPESVALWVGGAGVLGATVPEGVVRLASLDDALRALAAWRLPGDQQRPAAGAGAGPA
ncbi:HTH-type transcriptional repressor CarH [Massilia agilis]